MKRALTVVSMTALAMALSAQTTPSQRDPGMSPGTVQSDPQTRTPRTTPPDEASPQAGQSQRQPVQAAAVTAELTKKIDTKNAKAGDEVDARTTTATKMPDGTELPRGTKLVGKVTDVQAKSKDAKDSRLSFSVEKIVMKDGHEVPIRAAVASVAAPASNSPSDTPMGSSPVPAQSGSTSGQSGQSGQTGSGTAASSGSSVPVTGSDESQTAAGMLRSANDRVQVGNMPGVVLTGANSPDSSAMLEASGKDINLASGTKILVLMAMNQPGPGQ
jgi:hypothetical protein